LALAAGAFVDSLGASGGVKVKVYEQIVQIKQKRRNGKIEGRVVN